MKNEDKIKQQVAKRLIKDMEITGYSVGDISVSYNKDTEKLDVEVIIPLAGQVRMEDESNH